jgi:hypothetical protein
MRTLPLPPLVIVAGACCALSPQDNQRTSTQPSGVYAVQISSQLNASSQSDLDQQLTAAFTGGAAHPADVRNCAEMLAQGARGAGSNAAGTTWNRERPSSHAPPCKSFAAPGRRAPRS